MTTFDGTFADVRDETRDTSIDSLTERRRVLADASRYLDEVGGAGCRDAAARLRQRVSEIDERLAVLRAPAQDDELNLIGALHIAVETSRARKAKEATDG